MKTLTENQKDFIKENYADEIDEIINNRIDIDLIYHDDIYENLKRFSSITEALNGNYTMCTLYEDMYSDYFNENFDEIVKELYDDVTDEERKEIDNA